MGYFRNGEYLKFKGDIKDEKSVLKWLTSDKAIMLPDQIEEVNELMLSKVFDVFCVKWFNVTIDILKDWDNCYWRKYHIIVPAVIAKKSNMFVFFYDNDDVESYKMVRGLEKMDDELHTAQGNVQ